MITFDQTLDAVERIYEHLRSAAEMDDLIEHMQDNLTTFSDMLQYAHQRDFDSAQDALKYMDTVLLPQLQGIIDALESGTEEPLRRLNAATDAAQRLVASLELVTGESADDFTP